MSRSSSGHWMFPLAQAFVDLATPVGSNVPMAYQASELEEIRDPVQESPSPAQAPIVNAIGTYQERLNEVLVDLVQGENSPEMTQFLENQTSETPAENSKSVWEYFWKRI